MRKTIYTEYEAYKMYDEYLDEVQGEVVLFGMTYNASDVLRNVDPIAYKVGFSDWVDAMAGEFLVQGYF